MEYRVVPDGLLSPKFGFYVERIADVNQRIALLDLFTPHQRHTLFSIPAEIAGKSIIVATGRVQELNTLKEYFTVHVPKKVTEGEDLIITDPTAEYYVYGIHVPADQEGVAYLYLLTDDASEPPFKMYEQFTIDNTSIENYKGNQPLLTDVGKFLLNQLILVYPFGDLIPYHNDTFKPGAIDDIVARLILDKKVTREMYNKYMNYGYWYGMDGSIATPTWSEKALTTDPKIKEKKKELLAKYKDHLDDPVVLAQIEEELGKIDKEWLKGDVAAPFFEATSKKTSEQRKKLFLTFGLTASFDKNSGSYEFVEESLDDGWTIKNLGIAANDVRRGSYGRGIETAKGGEQTKFVLRIFQELSVDEDDCRSKRGLKMLITKYNRSSFVGRWTVGGVLITEELADQSIGKVLEIRSPQYCRTRPGICYKCAGELFRKLDMKAIGMNGVIITSGMTTTAMATMHSGQVDLVEITDFHRFLR